MKHREEREGDSSEGNETELRTLQNIKEHKRREQDQTETLRSSDKSQRQCNASQMTSAILETVSHQK